MGARLRAFWPIVATVSVMGGCGSCVKEEESTPLPKANLSDPIDAQAIVRPAPDLKRLVISPDAQP
jgi:hypothetical protein